MKTFLLLLLVLLLLPQAQTESNETPDVVVIKFKCGRHETGNGMVRSSAEPDAPMNEPIRINQIARNEPQEVKNRRDMQERRADMAISEANAARSGQTPTQLYFYKIQLQNTGTKIVKSVAWEYQPTSEPDPVNRQFYCVINAKPSDKKDYELFSPLSPSRVVDVSKNEGQQKGRVIINKIEYADGTFWKRMGWNRANFRPEDTSKVGSGKCIGI
jgi:hypothetical protein